MKYIARISIFCLTCFFASSCQKDDVKPITNDTIITATEYIIFGVDADTYQLKFSSSGTWTATISDNASSWCRLNKRSGFSGDNIIDIIVDNNNSYDERNASISIICGKAKSIITITQKQKDALILESNKIEVSEQESVISLTVQSNVDYNYVLDDNCKSWVHTNSGISKALSTSRLSFKVDANEDLTQREGKIYITAGLLTEVVTIFQMGSEPKLVISENNIIVSSTGEIIKIEISSNTEYEYKLPDVDWITEPQSRTLSEYTHYFKIDENLSYDQRSAEIPFINKANGETEIVTITQMQKDAIIIARNNYNISGEQQILDFTVNTNVDFEINISSEWIQEYTQESSRSLTERHLSLLIDANPSTTERSATISLNYNDLKQTILINQVARTDKMKISIIHSETEFLSPEFQGNNISGIVTWGDGAQSELGNSHYFNNSYPKNKN